MTAEEQRAVDELWKQMGQPCSACPVEWNDWIDARETLLRRVRLNPLQPVENQPLHPFWREPLPGLPKVNRSRSAAERLRDFIRRPWFQIINKSHRSDSAEK